MNHGWNNEQELDQTSVLALEAKVTQAFELRKKIKQMESEVEKEKRKLGDIQKEVMAILECAGKKSYASEVGTFTRESSLSVKVPSTVERKKAFFMHLKKKYGEEMMWEFVSIHSQKLNSFYKEEFREATESGVELVIPGLEPPTVYEKPKLRSK